MKKTYSTVAEAEAAKAKTLAAGRRIASKADDEGRALTADERAKIKAHVDEAADIAQQIPEIAGNEALRGQLSGIGSPHGARKTRGDGTWAKAATAYLGAIGAKARASSPPATGSARSCS